MTFKQELESETVVDLRKWGKKKVFSLYYSLRVGGVPAVLMTNIGSCLSME